MNLTASCGDVKGTAIISWNEPVLTYGFSVNYTVEYWLSESPTRKFYIHTGRGKSATVSVESERFYIFQVRIVGSKRFVLRSAMRFDGHKDCNHSAG